MKVWRDAPTLPQMITIPAGTLELSTGRTLVVEHPFAIGQFAVSWAEYDWFCVHCGVPLGDDAQWGRGMLPAVNVSWLDACAYTHWLFAITGRPYRLPSGAEWEFAARAGCVDPLPGEAEPLCDRANLRETPGYGTVPIHSFEPNAWGLYGALGNVAEWTWTDGEPSRLAVRGGHWLTPGAEMSFEWTEAAHPLHRSSRVGMRVVAAV